MSFSSEVKKQLSEIEAKKQCCQKAFEAGKSGGTLDEVCEKDAGAYLRGAFIRSGFVSCPGKNFMLSFGFKDGEDPAYLAKILEKSGLYPKAAVRKGKPLLYFKKAEDIEDVISLCGGTKIALDMISEIILIDVRNNTNRICNAETANLDRMAKAAAEQIEAIKKLEAYGILRNLPQELRECAELRLANPDMSLSELRALMREPVSKSGLNHRFRRLIEISRTETV
ncbi:MAG: DNA-binding protein WhiA [Clostridia bacterium]|nr:DNA-binding protein WhiA [Clostridia bacterium]